MDLSHPAIREIIDLHQFFEDWFNGSQPNTDVNFQRFADVMAADFYIVNPDGSEVGIDGLLPRLSSAWGKQPGVKIWIEGARVLLTEGNVIIARYEEWQRGTDSRGTDSRGTDTSSQSTRLSTVIFRQSITAPNGLQWVRVHETWQQK